MRGRAVIYDFNKCTKGLSEICIISVCACKRNCANVHRRPLLVSYLCLITVTKHNFSHTELRALRNFTDVIVFAPEFMILGLFK